MDRWRAVVNAVMKLRVAWIVRNFLSSREPLGVSWIVSRRAQWTTKGAGHNHEVCRYLVVSCYESEVLVLCSDGSAVLCLSCGCNVDTALAFRHFETSLSVIRVSMLITASSFLSSNLSLVWHGFGTFRCLFTGRFAFLYVGTYPFLLLHFLMSLYCTFVVPDCCYLWMCLFFWVVLFVMAAFALVPFLCTAPHCVHYHHQSVKFECTELFL